MMKTLICLILVILVSSCSNKNQLSYAERDNAYIQYISDNDLIDAKRINSFRFHGWQSLSRKFLIISTSIKRKYLIEIMSNCNELMFTQNIILNQSTSSSLHARFDSISTFEEPYIPCHIQAIYPITIEQAKEINSIGVPTNESSNETNSDN